MEQDSYYSVDELGTPFAGGGFNASLRDMARFGELIRNKGRLAAVARRLLPSLTTRNCLDGPIATCGGTLATLTVPLQPVAANSANDPTSLPGYEALARYLIDSSNAHLD